MHYEEIAPTPALARYVKCFWTLRGVHKGALAPERILPDGSFELVFHRGDPFVSDGASQPRAVIIGQVESPMIVHPSHEVDVVGVRFHVGGAAPFLPVEALAGRTVALDDVMRLGDVSRIAAL